MGGGNKNTTSYHEEVIRTTMLGLQKLMLNQKLQKKN